MKKIIPIIILAVLILPQISWAACTWYGTGDPATANNSQDNTDSGFVFVQQGGGGLSLPAGVVSKLRIYMSSTSNTNGVKLGLYDNSGNRIAATDSFANSSGSNFWIEVDTNSTPTISAASYKLAFAGLGGGYLIAVLNGQPSDTSYINLSANYTTQMSDPIASDSLARTDQMFMAACVTPSGGGGGVSTFFRGLITFFGWD